MFKINNKPIGNGCPTYIIAEIGTNHNGQVDLALRMVEEAKKAGADAIKIQLTDAEQDYEKGSPSYNTFKQVELTQEEWRQVADFAKQCSIDMFASFAQPRMIEISRALGFPAIKISSGNLNNYPLLKVVAQAGLPIILSTGMSYLKEVQETVNYLELNGAEQIAILQCTSLYPLSVAKVNLRAIDTLSKAFPDWPIGFSDHTEGITCALAAVARGACIVEKHVTLDQSMAGPEHHFSITMQDLKKLVAGVREIESALGDLEKKPVLEEMDGRNQFRRKLIAAVNIRQGEILGMEHLTAKRSPKPGLGAEHYEKILGKKIKQDIASGAVLTAEMI